MLITDQSFVAALQLVPIFKDLRTTALAVLKDISAQLVKRAAVAGSNESRTTSVNSCDATLLVQVSSAGSNLAVQLIDNIPSLIAISSSHMPKELPTLVAKF